MKAQEKVRPSRLARPTSTRSMFKDEDEERDASGVFKPPARVISCVFFERLFFRGS